MTYCVGILVREGLVMIADTRTNAGIDNIATFRKLHLFEKPGESVMAIATAGNLAVSQSVITLVSEGMEDPETARTADDHRHAEHVQGGAVPRPRHPRGASHHRRGTRAGHARLVRRVDAVRRSGQGRPAAPVHALRRRQLHRGDDRHALPSDRRAQIRQADPRPLDHRRHRPRRSVEARADLDGLDDPFEPRRRPADRSGHHPARRVENDLNYRIEAAEPYFHDLRERWSAALRAAHKAIPSPPYK